MANDNIAALLAMKGGSGGGGGGGTEFFVCTFSGLSTCDKTYAEAKAAYDAGKEILFVYEETCAIAQFSDDGSDHFSAYMTSGTSPIYAVALFLVFGFDATGSKKALQPAPATVTDTSSTSITLALAADNTIYEYGTLSALTVTAIAASGNFIISWRSGSTPTNHNFPSTMRFPTANNAMDACEANTDYEVNCRNGKCEVQSWPVVSP